MPVTPVFGFARYRPAVPRLSKIATEYFLQAVRVVEPSLAARKTDLIIALEIEDSKFANFVLMRDSS